MKIKRLLFRIKRIFYRIGPAAGAAAFAAVLAVCSVSMTAKSVSESADRAFVSENAVYFSVLEDTHFDFWEAVSPETPVSFSYVYKNAAGAMPAEKLRFVSFGAKTDFPPSPRTINISAAEWNSIEGGALIGQGLSLTETKNGEEVYRMSSAVQYECLGRLGFVVPTMIDALVLVPFDGKTGENTSKASVFIIDGNSASVCEEAFAKLESYVEKNGLGTVIRAKGENSESTAVTQETTLLLVAGVCSAVFVFILVVWLSRFRAEACALLLFGISKKRIFMRITLPPFIPAFLIYGAVAVWFSTVAGGLMVKFCEIWVTTAACVVAAFAVSAAAFGIYLAELKDFSGRLK